MMRPPKQKKRSSSKRSSHNLARAASERAIYIERHFAAVRIREQERLERKKQDALEVKSIRAAAWRVVQCWRRDPKSGSGMYRVQSGQFTIGLNTPFNPVPREFNSEKLEHRFEYRLIIWRPKYSCLIVVWTNWEDIRVERIHHNERWREKFLNAAKCADDWQ
jgi:hypothetical protein